MANQVQTVALLITEKKTKHTPGQQEIKYWADIKTQSGNMEPVPG